MRGLNGEDLAGVCDRLANLDDRLHRLVEMAEEVMVLGVPHTTTTVRDAYGNAPVVQHLDEPGRMLAHYRGEVVQVVGWVLDADGDYWPVIRSERQLRPLVVRDVDRFEPGLDAEDGEP
jgi:hypothetical protein